MIFNNINTSCGLRLFLVGFISISHIAIYNIKQFYLIKYKTTSTLLPSMHEDLLLQKKKNIFISPIKLLRFHIVEFMLKFSTAYNLFPIRVKTPLKINYSLK